MIAFYNKISEMIIEYCCEIPIPKAPLSGIDKL
jgi:hypothetical protein